MYTDIFFCCHMHCLVLSHRTQANFILSFLTLLFTSLNFYGWLFLCLWPCVVRWVLYLLIYNAIPSISCSSVMDTQNNTMRLASWSFHNLRLTIWIQCFSSPKSITSRGLLVTLVTFNYNHDRVIQAKEYLEQLKLLIELECILDDLPRLKHQPCCFQSYEQQLAGLRATWRNEKQS